MRREASSARTRGHGFAEAPSLSCDDASLYFHLKEGDAFSIFRVTR